MMLDRRVEWVHVEWMILRCTGDGPRMRNRQVVHGEDKIPRRYLVILPGTPDNHGAAVQVQRE